MKRVFIATCMAAACAIGLSAQQPSTTTSPQSGRHGGPMTVTGCVKAGDTSGTYMLTDIQRSDAGGGSGATTTTGAATTTAGGQGRGMGQLMLNSGAPDVDLSAHVGHKVEVTGMMSGGRGRMAGGAATTADTGAGSGSTSAATTTGGQGGARGMRSMNVTSVKMIASSCSE